ncbi:unnamed protein product [Penicillium salamii]|nr:unnamed protein product [Penicillium salamii]
MALPPEQINIKRRREEEPVETLFIQSAVHQTKRRFTDFIFQRVTLKASQVDDGTTSPPTSPHPAAQRLLRSPRSVSSLHVKRRAPASSTGVPTVRATSPGAEFREAQRVATARKEAEERHRNAIYSGPSPFSDLPALPKPDSNASTASRPRSPARASSPSRAQALRRFQISRSNLASLHSTGGGVQKRRAGPAPGVAVLVEQLQRNPHSRKGSMVSDMIAEGETHSRGLSALSKELVADPVASSPTKPRKRPVVNQAEKRWREQRRGTISTAKQNLSDSLEKSASTQDKNWDEESERLAREFEQVALEIEQDQEEENGMDVDSQAGRNPPAPVPHHQPVLSSGPKTPLKHQPRLPKEPRVAPSPAASQVTKSDEAVEEDDEGDYVYDVYIRRPLSESEMLKNPLAEYESEQQQKSVTKSQPGVGVIVITAEDEQYWEDFVEDDEEEWDSEDADSNAENNPANDYPDEEISSDDDDDDEFDFDDSASEDGGDGYMSRWRGPVDSDDEY